MELNLTHQAAGYRQQHKRTSIWKKITMVLASVVVFCTTYALILPAITMEQDVICGLEEHIHEESCYTAAPSVAVTELFCDRDTLAIHSHDESCLDENDLPACGYADFVIHRHDVVCYDADGLLQCALPEIEAHAHGEGCWQPPHVHTETCYTAIQGELLCLETEGMPHAHGETCYTPRQNLICTLPEVVGHTHSESCMTVTTTLVCQLTEEEAHAHDETCLDENGALACAKAETDGHAHDDACYEITEAMTCTLPEQEGHSHGEGCYETVSDLTCQLSDAEPHVHADACYLWTPQLICEALTVEEGAQPTLICQLDEIVAHTHDETCFTDGVLTCGKTEVLVHIHQADDCYQVTIQESQQQVLSCGQEEHTHVETCYPDQEEADGDLSGGDSLTDIRYCGIAAHGHVEACYGADGTLMCTMTEHEHDWLCDLAPSDPTAVETREEWETDLPELKGEIAADLIAVAESQLGYEEIEENYIIEDDELLYYSRYNHWWDEENPYGDWNAKFVSFCLEYADIDLPLGEAPADWHMELLQEGLGLPYGDDPIAADLVFFDTDSDSEADRAGIVSQVNAADGTFTAILERRGLVQQVTYDLDDSDIMDYVRIPGNEPVIELMDFSNVQNVINLIEALPTADQFDATQAAYEDAEDYEGLEAWRTAAVQQMLTAHYAYEALSEAEKAMVTNYDKLDELSYVWSAETLADSNTYEITAVNSYTSGCGAFIVRGGRGCTVAQSGAYQSDDFEWWYAIVVHLEDGQYVVKEVNPPQSGLSKMNVYAPYDGFVLMLHAETIGKPVNVSVGDYVSMGGSNFWRHTTAYTEGTVLGTVKFFDEPVSHATPYWSEPTRVTENIADTNEFIDLNLYDYGSNINDKFMNYTYTYDGYSGVTLWPGFQWNGGAYNLNDSYHRHQVDYIDFGNSLITDLEYDTKISSASYDYAKSANAVSVGKTYNYEYAEPETTGIINRLWRDGTDWSSITNRPIGMSMNDSTTETTYDVLKPILSPGGYPVILSSDSVSGFGGVLDYLFSDNTYADKVNDSTINGLFQINPTTGEYFFNSRWNHAQYDSDSNTFGLYEEVITPNFIIYPFGNFLPFNTITDGLTSANVKDIEAGTLKNYLAEEVSQKLSYSDSSESQLRTMLSMYRSSLNPDTAGSAWHTYSGLDAIRDYFWGDGSTDSDGDANDDKPSIHTSDIGELVENGDLYNIDFDVQTNFFFGMDMSMRFYQPKDGLTGNDNGNNSNGTWSTVATSIPTYRKSSLYVEEDTQILSGSPDGTPDYPMKFYFTGDDDVWVYIDGMLFLDLTGIHRHVGGEIDFQKGVVNYYELDVVNSGDISKTPYKMFTFKDLVTKAIKFKNRNNSSFTDAQLTAAVNEIINPDTGRFYDYSTHTFKFFYMERGSGSSVCRINFNFPLLRQNTLSVGKELTDDSDAAIGNPDFMFQVLDADTNGLFLPDGWAYSLYDVDGSLLQEIVVQSKYPDGRVEKMVIKDATGKVICTETYKADGTLDSRTGTDSDLAKVLRIGENGIFKLKAGQRAEFVGLPESWGKYYVRELLDNLDFSQYESVTVSGEATTKQSVTIGATEFVGLKSPILDMTNGSSIFRFNNKINTYKFGSLNIAKKLVVGEMPEESVSLLGVATTPEFTFEVKLDGVPLPTGTKYTVSGESTQRTVATAGHIIVPAGATATISHILSGAQFEVTEVNADGYSVSYQVDDGAITTESATGIIRESASVNVLATNYTGGTVATIPVIKNLTAPDTTADHTFRFLLEQVNGPTDLTKVEIPGTTTVAANPIEVTLKAGVTTASNGFILTYDGIETTQLPVVYYYKITEISETGTNVVYDPSVYVVEVSISAGGSATVTGMWKDGNMVDDESIVFTNTITGSLTLSKQVVGTTPENGFTFEITLKDSNDQPVTGTFPAILQQHDGTTVEDTRTFDANGTNLVKGVMDGESITIYDIPCGTTWTITETNADGYVVTYKVNDGEAQSGAQSTGAIIVGSTEVVYTNSAMYALPETGGSGLARILTCGGLLAIMPCLWLLRRQRYRGRRVTGG